MVEKPPGLQPWGHFSLFPKRLCLRSCFICSLKLTPYRLGNTYFFGEFRIVRHGLHKVSLPFAFTRHYLMLSSPVALYRPYIAMIAPMAATIAAASGGKEFGMLCCADKAAMMGESAGQMPGRAAVTTPQKVLDL